MNTKPNVIIKYLKVFFLSLLILFTIIGGMLGGAVVEVIKSTPDFDLSKISDALSENSTIVDSNGNLLEKIETVEYRELIGINDMPQFVKDAFLSVEDERFYEHGGVDPIGIAKSLIDNVIAGGFVRGGSTITQQLAKDLYLTNEKSLERKIKEAYIATKMNAALSKDEILEIYLNRVFLGQNAYGVQAASKTYFSKDIKDLTIAEAASLAAIPKAPTNYSLFYTVIPDENTEGKVLGETVIAGQKYFVVYNPNFEDRAKYVLSKMLELGKISQEEYDTAIQEDISLAIKVPERDTNQISDYFASLVKEQVVEKLIEKYNISRQEAKDKLYNGGLVITASVDTNMQKKLENIYSDFSKIVLSGDGDGSANFLNLSKNDDNDIVDHDGKVIYFRKSNVFNENNDLVFYPGQFEFTDQGLTLKSERITINENGIIVKPFYTVTEENDIKTHSPTILSIKPEYITKTSEGKILISNDFLLANPEFESHSEDALVINKKFYSIDDDGVIQPQSSTVVLDHSNGEIKAIIGGRGQSGRNILNRAYSSVRQPGSTMKPIAVYGPALDNGKTLATIIDDVPHYNESHVLWPVNWYGEYRGLTTIRESIETSANVNAVKMLEEITIPTSKKYLTKLGIINEKNPELDNFVSREENPSKNDENTAAMALGGMTYGVTNLDLTSAYSTIANKGIRMEPLSFTKVTDSKGNVILENSANKTEVFKPSVAFLLADALHTTTNRGVAANAKVEGYQVAGKTGTSGTATENQDSWFMGFTSYYTVGVWMGADDPQLKLKEVSMYSTRLWGIINKAILEGLAPKDFEIPKDVIKIPVCTKSGLLPTEACYADPRGCVREEYFIKGTEPTKECNVHVFRTVDSTNGLLAPENTPDHAKSVRSFITRPIPYDPAKNDNIYPTDWQYMAPTKYSDVKHKSQEELDKEKEEKKKKEEEEKKRRQGQNQETNPNPETDNNNQTNPPTEGNSNNNNR